MFDNYIFTENSCKNTVRDGKVVGFELKTLICYYRSAPLSMVEGIGVVVDGAPVPAEKIRFSANGEDWFTLKEMETVTSYKWEYGQHATVFVDQPGGVSPGAHDVTLTVTCRTDYIPVPFSGTRSRKVVIS